MARSDGLGGELMSACEACWTEATLRAITRGGFTADRYREVLAEHELIGDHVFKKSETETEMREQ